MVKSTNLPSSGTTKLVGGMISANSKKNTVSESKMEMDRLTCGPKEQNACTNVSIYLFIDMHGKNRWTKANGKHRSVKFTNARGNLFIPVSGAAFLMKFFPGPM
jgi:hypothetical protein